MFKQIKNTIKLTTDVYLHTILSKIPNEKKSTILSSYEKDIERIANYFYNSDFFNDDFQLTEDFLKWFHKSLYPEWYIQRKKDEKWREFIWMIPGEYKHIKIISKDWVECTDHEDIPNWDPKREIYTTPENTKKEMKKLVEDFNDSFNKISDSKEKMDFILFFMLDLLYIHPFSDGNGRVYNIFGDLFYLKIGLQPIWFMGLRENNRLQLHKSMYMSYITRDLKFIYDFIEKVK